MGTECLNVDNVGVLRGSFCFPPSSKLCPRLVLFTLFFITGAQEEKPEVAERCVQVQVQVQRHDCSVSVMGCVTGVSVIALCLHSNQPEQYPFTSSHAPKLRTNHAAQVAIIKYVTRQESRSSAGNCQADEPTGITQLRWQLSCR